MKKSSLPFVIVSWNDPNSSSVEVITEENIADFHKPEPMETGGWLLRDDAEGVSLANERYFEKDKPRYRGHTFISRALVTGMTDNLLKTVRRRKPTASNTLITDESKE